MRGWPPAPLDPMKFPLTLGGHLRRAFNHVVSSPLPQKLAELVRRVKSDETDARKGAETSSRSDRQYHAELHNLTAGVGRSPAPGRRLLA